MRDIHVPILIFSVHLHTCGAFYQSTSQLACSHLPSAQRKNKPLVLLTVNNRKNRSLKLSLSHLMGKGEGERKGRKRIEASLRGWEASKTPREEWVRRGEGIDGRVGGEVWWLGAVVGGDDMVMESVSGIKGRLNWFVENRGELMELAGA